MMFYTKCILVIITLFQIEHECQEVTDGPVQNIEEETKEVELDVAKDAKPTQV